MTPEEFQEIFGRGFGGRTAGGFGAAGGGDYSDFFEALFGGAGDEARGRTAPRSRPGRDVDADIQVTLEEAFNGATRVIQWNGGRRIEVKVPRGVATGSRVRISGQGEPGSGNAVPGNLYLNVTVLPDPRFQREGSDLRTKIPVDLYSAILGGDAQVPTLERPVMLTIPPGTQNGRVFRLRGLGMPELGNPERRGDLLAEVDVRLPTRITPEQRRLFEQLRDMAQS